MHREGFAVYDRMKESVILSFKNASRFVVRKEITMHEQDGCKKSTYLPHLPRRFSLLWLLALLLLAACGGSNTSVPDAHQLISKAQAAIKTVTTYHFKLTTDHPGTG